MPPFAHAPRPMTPRQILLWSVLPGVLAFAVLAAISPRIDFHPDEAIYFDTIPVSLRNDSGILFNLLHGLMQMLHPGPQGARQASALLGGLSLSALACMLARAGARPWQLVLLCATWLLSYQVVFVYDRVRPEAVWWTLAAIAPCLLYRARWSRAAIAAVGCLLFLLPLNHRLSWFPSAFVLGFLFFFARREVGLRAFLTWPAAFMLGVAVNIVARTWWLGTPIAEAIGVATQSVSNERQSLRAFFHLVFRDAATALNDSAANPNIFRAIRRHDIYWASHAYIQNALWMVMLVLPLLGRSWRERYVLAIPLGTFLCFFISGYYNPTYAPGMSMLCVLLCLWLLISRSGIVRVGASVVVGLSILNGVSFLATRVLNHGEATYFAEEAAIRTLLRETPGLHTVALPERYQIAASGLPLKRYVNYKDARIPDVDILVLENYDLLMYGFVPDFDQRKAELKALAGRMCLMKRQQVPVYLADSAFPLQPDGWGATFSHAGSWFFRNSVTTTLSIYQRCR